MTYYVGGREFESEESYIESVEATGASVELTTTGGETVYTSAGGYTGTARPGKAPSLPSVNLEAYNELRLMGYSGQEAQALASGKALRVRSDVKGVYVVTKAGEEIEVTDKEAELRFYEPHLSGKVATAQVEHERLKKEVTVTKRPVPTVWEKLKGAPMKIPGAKVIEEAGYKTFKKVYEAGEKGVIPGTKIPITGRAKFEARMAGLDPTKRQEELARLQREAERGGDIATGYVEGIEPFVTGYGPLLVGGAVATAGTLSPAIQASIGKLVIGGVIVERGYTGADVLKHGTEEQKRKFLGETAGIITVFGAPKAVEAGRVGLAKLRPIRAVAKPTKPTMAEARDVYGRKALRVGAESEYEIYLKSLGTKAQLKYTKVGVTEARPVPTEGKFPQVIIREEATGRIIGYAYKGPKGKMIPIQETIVPEFKGKLKGIELKTKIFEATEPLLSERLDVALKIKPTYPTERPLKPTKKAFGVKGTARVQVGKKTIEYPIEIETLQMRPERIIPTKEIRLTKPTKVEKLAIRKAKLAKAPEEEVLFEALGEWQAKAITEAGVKPTISGFKEAELVPLEVTYPKKEPAEFVSRFKARMMKGWAGEEVFTTGKPTIDIFEPLRPKEFKVWKGKIPPERLTPLEKTFGKPPIEAKPKTPEEQAVFEALTRWQEGAISVSEYEPGVMRVGGGLFQKMKVPQRPPELIYGEAPPALISRKLGIKEAEIAGKEALRQMFISEAITEPIPTIAPLITPTKKPPTKIGIEPEFEPIIKDAPKIDIIPVEMPKVKIKPMIKKLPKEAVGITPIEEELLSPLEVPAEGIIEVPVEEIIEVPEEIVTPVEKVPQIEMPEFPRPDIPFIPTPDIPHPPEIRIPPPPTPPPFILFGAGVQRPKIRKPVRKPKRKAGYTPTLWGVISEEVIEAPPKGIFTGMEIRYPVAVGKEAKPKIKPKKVKPKAKPKPIKKIKKKKKKKSKVYKGKKFSIK